MDGDVSATKGEDVATAGFDGCVHRLAIEHVASDGKHGGQIDFTNYKASMILRARGLLPCRQTC